MTLVPAPLAPPGASLLEAAGVLHVLLLEVELHVELLVHVAEVTGGHQNSVLDPVGRCSNFLKTVQGKLCQQRCFRAPDDSWVFRITPLVLQFFIIETIGGGVGDGILDSGNLQAVHPKRVRSKLRRGAGGSSKGE